MNESSNQKQEIIDTRFKSDPETQVNNKHETKNTMDENVKMIECPPDGTIVKTPCYLEKLPNEILDLILFYVFKERKSMHYKQLLQNHCYQSKLIKRGLYQQSLQNDLYQCSLINKQFYQQTIPLLWHAPLISNPATLKRFVTSLVYTQVIPSSSSDSLITNNIVPLGKHCLRRLDIKSHSGWDNIEFLHIMPFLGLLETLTIDYYAKSKVTDVSLKYLPQYCPHLNTLGFVPTSSFTKRFIHTIIQKCPHLGQIELYLTHTHLHHNIFKSLLDSPSLTKLVLQDNTEEVCCKSFLTKNMVMDMMALHRLKSLVFIGRGLASTLQRIFNMIDYRNSSNTWLTLSSLHIDYGACLFGDSIMVPFIVSHHHLQCLDLDNTQFSDLTLDAIATHLPHLTHLRLYCNNVITRKGVYHLVRRCHSLKQANFPCCYRLLRSMVEFPRIQHYPKYGLTITDMDKIRQRGDNND